MKALKTNVELERQLKEAEAEIERKKKEEAAQKAPAERGFFRASSGITEDKEKDVRTLKNRAAMQGAAAYFAENGIYLLAVIVASAFGLIGAYYGISTGFLLTGGVGGMAATPGESLAGILLILLGIVSPLGLIGATYFLLGKRNDPLACFIPLAVSFVVTIVFLFVV